MTHRFVTAGSEVRLLSDDELTKVGGGVTTWGPDLFIDGPGLVSDGGNGGGDTGSGDDDGYTMDDRPNPETGGSNNNDLQAAEDCRKDTQADLVRDAIMAAPQNGNERGAIIYKDSSGNIVVSPIAEGLPGQVRVPLPDGVSMSQVVGFIHSHPTAPRSGDAEADARYDHADMYPSPPDWDQMDIMVAGGANAAHLSFYVVDMHGDLREYNYSDKSIYDVPEDQLLGLDGMTPPPLPDAMNGGCGS